MNDLPLELIQSLNHKKENHAFRSLKTFEGVDFFSNDYLGFAREAVIHEKALEHFQSFSNNLNGSTGSRLLSGNHLAYEQLEQTLCETFEVEAALVYNSGFSANIGWISAILQKNDLVLYDALCHASIRDGLKMSPAKSYKFRHNDLSDLRNKYEQLKGCKNIYLITESVFSVDGDLAPLDELKAFCDANEIRMIVDCAHSSGIYSHDYKQYFLSIVTFGKSYGVHGASLLCRQKTKDYLINHSRSLIYTTALDPFSVLKIKAAIELSRSEKAAILRSKLLNGISYFLKTAEELNLMPNLLKSTSAIQGIKCKDNAQAIDLQNHLQQHKFALAAIRYPTVAKGEERIRVVLHAINTEDEIKRLLETIHSYFQSQA
ncbi:MAG: 8-amino-7-oxononanoate synthase [Flavobacteriaceae bacterium]|nr:8-amino-7-oxononanoate synthase [Flavobacteriaceae bacterium]